MKIFLHDTPYNQAAKVARYYRVRVSDGYCVSARGEKQDLEKFVSVLHRLPIERAKEIVQNTKEEYFTFWQATLVLLVAFLVALIIER